MTQEKKDDVDNEISFIIACLYQRGETTMAHTLEENVMELWNYINELESE